MYSIHKKENMSKEPKASIRRMSLIKYKRSKKRKKQIEILNTKGATT